MGEEEEEDDDEDNDDDEQEEEEGTNLKYFHYFRRLSQVLLKVFISLAT